MNLDIRQAVSADSAWLYETYKQTMIGFVTRTTGWDEHAQRNGFAKSLRQGSCSIALRGGERCGFVHWEVEPDLVWLRMLCIVPAMQRQAIGRQLLGDVLLLSEKLGRPLYLHVFRCNEVAYGWYRRMGFAEIETEASNDDIATLALGGQ
ncbi:GCN5-related N-acetyltransferase [Caballeronia sordidicola]|uniref:GCN5-related N-acetyltransferase n=1 Tax=Caballeronia sordidicola TaxID=196367 RepID=A0A158FMK5_CABSO|nr:GNAT family N-acetyltransferase [Caballeronia sordidicola]SAL20861.1 GCN5-related N-acetyltransferase [Caballeronia sordidicola]